MRSIRKRLLVSTLSLIILTTLLLATATYFSVREEMDELYDENMKQIAIVVARAGFEDSHVSAILASPHHKLKSEQEYLIQIWREGKLAYTSHPAIAFELQKREHRGFGTVAFKTGVWRYYYLQQGRDTIQIAQDIEGRHGVIAEIYRVLVVPILIQLPILALLIWLSVSYGFRPLTKVSNLIRKRTPTFLEPLPNEDVPLEISTLVGALNDLLTRLKAALEVQRRFTADAAHELRTPLTATRLQLDILKRAVESHETDEAVANLEKGVTRSIRLVEQLLELARQEPDKSSLPLTAVSLNEVIEEIAELALPLGKAKLIDVILDLEEGLMIIGNAGQLAVMVGNLVNNAIIYTPSGGRVKISARKDHHRIILDVADNGIGIAPGDRDRVFDRFFRVGGTEATGSGLGLSIVKSIALSYGVEIILLGGLDNKGTTFRLIFNSLP